MEIYILNGEEITLEELQALADEAQASLEDFKYFNKVEVKKVKQDPNALDAAAGEDKASLSPESRLANLRSEYKKSNENFVVGKPSDIYNYFSGEIDDIAIWNRALGSGEIEDYYIDSNVNSYCDSSNFLLQDGLVGYWPFCENSNDVVGDNN